MTLNDGRRDSGDVNICRCRRIDLTTVLLAATAVGTAGSSYLLLAIATASRMWQAVGVPIATLVAITLIRYPRQLDNVARRQVMRGITVVLMLSLAVQSVVLLRGVGGADGPVLPDCNVGLRPVVRRLIEMREWNKVTELVHSAESLNDPQLLQDGAFAHRKLEQVSYARTLYCRALALDPGNPEIRYELARLYEQLGELGNAAMEYERVLNITGGRAEVHLAYGVLLAAMGHRAAGIAHVEHAVAASGENDGVRTAAEDALRSLLLADGR